MGCHHVYLSASSSSIRASRMMKPFTAYLPTMSLTPRRCSNDAKNKENDDGHGLIMEERAPSIEDEFRRVAEEKAHHNQHQQHHQQHHQSGFASQTIDSAQDAAAEAVGSDSDFESVKQTYKQPAGGGGGGAQRKGDQEPSLPRGA